MVQKSSTKKRILVLMKRFGVGKDMVMQDFGRQIRLFENLSRKYEIDFFVPDYKKHERRDLRLRGMNFYIRPYSLILHFSFMGELKKLIKARNYDFIAGTSDPLLGILAYRLGKKYGIKSIYDMQDEYSCYLAYKIPFVRYIDKNAVKNSDIAIAVSKSLAEHIKSYRRKPIIVVQNGIDPKAFKNVRKKASRKSLKLPLGKIITYVGEISRFKGIDVLIDAFKEVKVQVPDSFLLLSGPIKDFDVKGKNVIYREFPKREQVLMALKASDVLVLPNVESNFSRYCFPYKIPEYMAAQAPIVATNIGDVSFILPGEYLCSPNDKFDLASKIIMALNRKHAIRYDIDVLFWKNLAKKIDDVLK